MRLNRRIVGGRSELMTTRFEITLTISPFRVRLSRV